MSEKKCPKCFTEMKEEKKWILISKGSVSSGGYFGERPEEYGEGFTEWVENGLVYKCPNCGFSEEKQSG